MKTTQVFDNKGVIKNRAYGFSFNKKKELIPSDQSLTSATKGDGGIYTSLHDYMLWDKALNDNKLVDLKTIFKKLYADLPDKNGKYSAGWFFNENTEGGLMMFHSGSTCGFSNIVIRVPEKKLLLLFFSNIADNHEAFKPIFNYLKQKNVIKTEIWKWHAATN
jgi:CubicO group peptidase (beta-lactamase class C family)